MWVIAERKEGKAGASGSEGEGAVAWESWQVNSAHPRKLPEIC